MHFQIENFVHESIKKLSEEKPSSDKIRITLEVSEEDLAKIIRILKEQNMEIEFVTE
jgi:biotin operon repressor